VNGNACRMLGYAREELIDANLSLILSPEYVALLSPPGEQLLQHGSFVFGAEFVRKDGSRVPVEINATILSQDSAGEIHLLAKDNSELRQTEELLQKERNQAQQYLDIAGVIILTLNTNEQVTMVNKKGCEILGYPVQEIVGKNWIEVFLPERDRARIRKVFTKFIAGDIESLTYSENPVLTASGEERIIAWHNTVLRDEFGNATGTLSSGQDITDHKRIEKALWESERKRAEEALATAQKQWQTTFDVVADPIMLLDVQGNIIQYNQALAAHISGHQGPVIGQKCYSIIHASPLPIENCPIKRAFQNGVRQESELFKDGRTFLITVDPVKTPAGRVTGFIHVMHDITERKQAEEALRKSEERFRCLAEAAFEAVAIHSDGILLHANDRFFAMTGYEPDEAIGKRLIPVLVAPEDQEFMTQQPKKTGVAYYKIRGNRKDGTTFPMEVLTQDMEYEGRKVRVVAIRDMTSWEEAEKALRDSEEMFRVITESIGERIFLLDMNLRIVYVSPSVVRDRDLTLEELQDLPLEKHLTPASWQTVRQIIAEELTPDKLSQKDLRIERMADLEFYRKDGSTFWSETTITVLRDPEGKPTGIVGVSRDITRRRQMEEALRESENRFRDMAELLPTAIIEADLDQKVTYINRRGLELFNYSWEDVKAGLNAMQFIAPLKPDQLTKKLECVFEGEGLGPFEMKLLKKDGSAFVAFIEMNAIKKNDRIIGVRAALQDITERKQVEKELRESERRFHCLADAAVEAVSIHDQGILLAANNQFFVMTGYEPHEVIGRQLHSLIVAPEFREIVEKQQAQGSVGPYEILAVRKDGTTLPVEIRSRPMVYAGRKVRVTTTLDISNRVKAEQERQKLQAQLLQAMKMEAVGRLAGGVAHDFNNMLQAIFSYCEVGLDETPAESIQYKRLLEIQKIAQRSANLIPQLLAFARKQAIAPTVLDLNAAVQAMLSMLRRLIGENIEIVWCPGHDLWPAQMDPSQLDQILANLAVNAQDAITGVGKLTIETENVTLDETYSTVHAGCIPGHYVLLAVSDNGSGMDQKTLNQIFEPFFTTKGPEEGTGLGLATVYGIVKQNSGFIYAYSEQGKGTTFKIYMPRFMGQASKISLEAKTAPAYGRGERILLVEDDITLLDVAKVVIERLGYEALSATTPSKALKLVQEHPGEISLLITDVVMPEMSGRELAERMIIFEPGLKCLFMSGYTSNAIAQHGVLDQGMHFIQKPFSMKDLAAKVRGVLEK